MRTALRNTTVFIALSHLFTLGIAQNRPQTAARDCPAARQVGQAHLLGTWRGQIDGVPGLTVIRLTSHPEHRDGVAGFLQRSAGGEPAVARVSGDVDEGIFTLEESEDGRRIAATWSGAIKEDSCGRTITGSWWRDNTDQRRAFELHKQIGWD